MRIEPHLSQDEGSRIEARVRPFGPVLLSANSFWNIINFRPALVDGLTKAGYSVCIAAPTPDKVWASAHGAKPIEISVDRSGLNPATDAVLWLHYFRLLHREKIGCYLGFTAKPNVYGCFAAQLLGIPAIPNVSGLGTAFIGDGPLSRFVGTLYRIAFRRCRIVFFQNPDDRDLFVTRKIVRDEQARLLPGSGIDLDHFVPSPTAEPAPPSFLFIGRLLGDKGVRDYVEAARLLRTDHPQWRFQILGDLDPANRSGVTANELQSWVDQGLVEHLGHVEDVRPWIAASTAVVLPSYREGLPRSLLEAAAMARPLIATDVPGNRQLVKHHINGLLCNVRDSSSLAQAMRTLGLMAPSRLAEMGQAGRTLVERDYGVDRVVDAYLDALAQLAGQAGVGNN
jgi:glycosyltransferase involved in cell wall biosynthesis